jgi:serine/threonine protein kinase
MTTSSAPNAIYFPEGAGYLLVKVLQTKADNPSIESDVMLVRSLDDNKLYVRKIVKLTSSSVTGIPNEIDFDRSFKLVPYVKDVTKYVHSPSGEYYWAMCTEFCNGGDLRKLLKVAPGAEPGTWIKLCDDVIWQFILDMIDTLKFLREEKIAHLDIYPQNIFIRYSDNTEDRRPTFLLGDFGWAVPLTPANQYRDAELFMSCLWQLCYGPEESCWEVAERQEGEYCSVALQKFIYSFISRPKNEATLDYLFKDLHELAAKQVQCSRVLPIIRLQNRTRTDFSKLCEHPEDPKTWPSKLENIPEDWQVVRIVESAPLPGVEETSGDDVNKTISLQGLGRTTYHGRDIHSFIRRTPDSFDLSLIHRFDASGNDFPPKTLTSSLPGCRNGQKVAADVHLDLASDCGSAHCCCPECDPDHDPELDGDDKPDWDSISNCSALAPYSSELNMACSSYPAKMPSSFYPANIPISVFMDDNERANKEAKAKWEYYVEFESRFKKPKLDLSYTDWRGRLITLKDPAEVEADHALLDDAMARMKLADERK